MPTDPQDLPSYEHPDYAALKPHLQVIRDCYESMTSPKLYRGKVIGSVKEKYLPSAKKEPPDSYKKRVERSTFDNKVRPIIDSNAGLLTVFEVSKLPPSLQANEENVDLKGSSLKSFLFKANKAALRDGCCYILSMQNFSGNKSDGEQSREISVADEMEDDRRPRWKIIERANVLNWRVEWYAGKAILTQVTILQHEEVPDGKFGLKKEPRYYFLRLVDGGVEKTVYGITEKGDIQTIEAPQVSNIWRIPLRPYFNSDEFWPSETPEFYKAASLNVKLFRQESTLDNIQYRVNAPTFWRRSRLPTKERPPFIAGENYVIELYAQDESNGPDEVGVLEIDGSGIEALMKSAIETREAIENESLGFLYGARVQRTATETYFSSAQVTSSLNGKARERDAAIAGMIEDWCMFTGEEPTVEIQQDHSLLEMPLDAQEMAQLLNLFSNEVLDHRTLLELLRMGRQLPPDFDIDEILERVKKEQEEKEPEPVANGVLELLGDRSGQQQSEEIEESAA